jgi:hypothetical protein
MGSHPVGVSPVCINALAKNVRVIHNFAPCVLRKRGLQGGEFQNDPLPSIDVYRSDKHNAGSYSDQSRIIFLGGCQMFGVRSSTGNDHEAPSSCRCRAVVLPDGSLRAVRWRRVSASAVSEIPARPTSRSFLQRGCGHCLILSCSSENRRQTPGCEARTVAGSRGAVFPTSYISR